MTSTITPHTTSPCFQLKGSMVTMMTLELYRFDEVDLHSQLQGLVTKAPRFFENTPVVIGLEHFSPSSNTLDISRLRSLCAGFGINLVAIRGGTEIERTMAANIGLACLAAQPQATARKIPQRNEASQTATVTPISQANLALEPKSNETAACDIEDEPEDKSLSLAAPRIVSTPVRSGQQIYHEGDLILTGPVSAGAEILAEGHIHAYGPFRGRALAGVKGNNGACIFCTQFEAELVSINGHYKLAANFDKTLIKRSAKINLEDDALIIQPL